MFKHHGAKITENTIKLVDFGLSTQALKNSNLLFRRCGTPGFIAPEVINFDKENDTADKCHNCDIFSVGVIFHFMLTGKLPFDGEDFKEILKSNEEGVIDWTIPELQVLSQSTIQLLKSMLESNPETRITPEEAINHPYFFNYSKFNTVMSKQLKKINTMDTNSTGTINEQPKLQTPIKNEKIGNIEDLFQTDSDIPDEQPTQNVNNLIQHLGLTQSEYKLSPFLQARKYGPSA